MSIGPHGPEFVPGPRNPEIVRFEADLAAERERNAELAAALERALKLGREMAGFVKSYGLDDHGPQSEWSRWLQCRSGLDNEADPSALLARVRAEAKREGAVEAQAEIDQLRTALRETRDALHAMVYWPGSAERTFVSAEANRLAAIGRGVLTKYAALAEEVGRG